MNLHYLNTLYDYHYWEQRRVWDDCVMQLSETQFMQDSGYSHGSIHAEVVHVMAGEQWWLARAKGESPQVQLQVANFPDRTSIRQQWDQVEAAMRAFISQLDETRLAAPVQYTTPKGEVIDNHVWAILLHVINHGTIHRAEILAIAHRLGGNTFDLSFMRWLKQGRY
jgi:uncharacterized damage-inducible protein DinB